MKTIKTKSGEIERLGDKEAEAKVKAGAKYCPKSEWKLVRDSK